MRYLFASRPNVMGRVLGIVSRCIATHLIKKAGFSGKTALAGAVTLIQCFGSVLKKSPGAILNSRGLIRRGGGQDARHHLNVHFAVLGCTNAFSA